MLEKEIDLQHICGYINFLRTGAPPQQPRDIGSRGQSSTRSQPTAEEKAEQSEISDFLEDLKELGIDDPKNTATAERPSSTQEETSDAGNQQQNGTETASKSHSNDTAGGTSEARGGGLYCEESMSPFQKKLLEEWVPLELSFGIPLFSDDANRTVCSKVI